MSYNFMNPWNFTMGQPQGSFVPSEFPQVLAFIAMLQRFGNAQQFLNFAKKAVVKEISSAKNPIAEGISFVGSSQCENLKYILQLQYKQVQHNKEPDVADLTIDYLTSDISTKFKLRSASTAMPKSGLIETNKTLVIFLHGFTDNPGKDNFQMVNNAMRETGNYNILALDASSLIGWLYLRSSTFVHFIGNALGKVLAELHKLVGLLPEKIHLVGHSLGAHIAGFTAKEFKRLTGKPVGRVTGLDPAGPCFTHIGDDERLKKTDGRFVDAIHTNGGVYGMIDAVGHQDFYLNGGSQQPDCLIESCSHSRAVEVYADSITNPDGYLAVKCDDDESFRNERCSDEIIAMGYAATPGPEGRFYLQTNDEKPYHRGIAGTKYVNTAGVVKNIENFSKDHIFG